MEPLHVPRRPHRPLALAGAALAVLLPWLGCAGAKSDCHAESWRGSCQLLGVTKVRESELPLPSVVLEAIYRPGGPGAPAPNLPDVRREFTALTKHEGALQQHLESQRLVNCYVNPPSPGTCQPGPIVVEVAEFDATRATAAAEEGGPKGCAQIEAASSQDRITQNPQQNSELIPERLLFAEASAELPPDAPAQIDAVAARLQQHANLECVGIVGQYVRGESMEVAFGRARAVRELLIARGIAPERLVVLTVSGQLVSTTANPDAPDPKDRRVAFSVLLDVKPKE